ncbi:MAG: potassium transporter Kup [Acidobacteria bacterium]|nr:potassium transporter Kup [Acidobacteriota bacterium]
MQNKTETVVTPEPPGVPPDVPPALSPDGTSGDHLKAHGLGFLALTALGVVFGDIGTSPLYSLKEAFHASHGIVTGHESILGMLSLVFWSLALVICVKYVSVIMRADNRGEGGILALMAMIRHRRPRPGERRPWLIILGLFGAALLYGDGIITPAISVLSAVEGLSVGTHALEPYVVPLTVVILALLFLFQKHGTARIGLVFGPVMILWFVSIAVLGLVAIFRFPDVLAAVNPAHAVRLFLANGWKAFWVLGSVVLCVTGGEALYADIGHFGRRPIVLSWYGLAFPCLVLNYFGQGALLLHNPKAVINPFYFLAPSWALFPLVALATLATIIASQAVITGAFSLSRQAVQLGYLPRLSILHTSASEIGQIYVPFINWTLMLSSIFLVLWFQTSTHMAAAYGLAVTGTMAVTTVLAFSVMRRRWRWNPVLAALVSGVFLVVDLAFLGANVIKIPAGGWVALFVGVAGYLAMSSWKRGREILAQRLKQRSASLEDMRRSLQDEITPAVVNGSAVYLSATAGTVPATFQFNLKHNKVIHEKVLFVTLVTEDIPRVAEADRVDVEPLFEHFYRVTGHFGFMESPSVPVVLAACPRHGLEVSLRETTFFMGRETLLTSPNPVMAAWRGKLFAFMSRNAAAAAKTFGVPPDQIVEIGVQIEL